MTCFVLTTEYLTMDVACDLQLICSFPWIVLMQFFFNLTPSFWGQGYFKQLEIKCRWFQYSLELLPSTILFFCLVIFAFLYSLLLFLNSNVPTLANGSGIFVEAGSQQTPCQKINKKKTSSILRHEVRSPSARITKALSSAQVGKFV